MSRKNRQHFDELHRKHERHIRWGLVCMGFGAVAVVLYLHDQHLTAGMLGAKLADIACDIIFDRGVEL